MSIEKLDKSDFTKLGIIGPVAVIVGMIVTVSNEDFKDEVRSQILYCENVKAGFWPDYDQIYETHCTEAKLKEYKNILIK